MGDFHQAGSRWYAYAFTVTINRELYVSEDGGVRWSKIPFAEPGEWMDPAFLSQLVTASIKISLAEGETKTQDIRIAR